MSKHSATSIAALVRHSMLQAVAALLVVAFFSSFVYSFIHHYQQQALHTQQLADMLADSASDPKAAALVSDQAHFLLASDPTLKNLSFYATDQPLSSLGYVQDGQDSAWYQALFSDIASFNSPVFSRYAPKSAINAASPSDSIEDNRLVGYINITLDIENIRANWLRERLAFLFCALALALLTVWLILRKLYRPLKDINELTKAAHSIIDNPNLEQLPMMGQGSNYQELEPIKQALTTLSTRLSQAQQDHKTLVDIEQQLHNKDLSLDMQRHNFQTMITYELKHSLNIILGGLQLLDSQYLTAEQRDTLALIDKGSQKLALSLEQIIQLSRIEKGQVTIHLAEFSPLTLIADLLEVFDPIAKQKELELISRIHHIDYILEGDASKIEQILTILLDNALKFTDEGSVIIESQMAHFNDSIRWQIKIIDSGIGIDASYVDDIFAPFFQIDSSTMLAYEGYENLEGYQGSGIGLSIIKQMLQLIGATIEVQSTLGQGSEFMVTIPLRNKYQSLYRSSLTGINILYYHIGKHGFLAEKLKGLGAEVQCQQHEERVLAQAKSSKVDIVMFADDVLPEQVAQLARQIRQNESTHRALLIYWYPPEKQKMLDSFEHGLKSAGVDYCHSSTLDPKVLLQLLKHWYA